MDPGGAFGGTPNPVNTASGHDCINMVNAKNVVTHSKFYSTSESDLGKENTPPESPLRIEKPSDKPEALLCIPNGVLKRLGHNPNSRAAQNYSIIKDLGQNYCVMSPLEFLQTCPL